MTRLGDLISNILSMLKRQRPAGSEHQDLSVTPGRTEVSFASVRACHLCVCMPRSCVTLRHHGRPKVTFVTVRPICFDLLLLTGFFMCYRAPSVMNQQTRITSWSHPSRVVGLFLLVFLFESLFDLSFCPLLILLICHFFLPRSQIAPL